MIAHERGEATTQTRIGVREALQRWLRACQEFEDVKRCTDVSEADGLAVLREAEKRIDKAADLYTEALYAFKNRYVEQGQQHA